ncbi:MAG: DNA glycosylase family protein, partial [Acidimicrobiales bacterium]
MPRPDPAASARTIVRADPAFRSLVRRVGPPPPRRTAPVGGRFASLTRSVTYQLLATKAAATIHARVVELCRGQVTPAAILAAGHDRLRAVGLSNAKAAAMLDLAERTLDG